MRRRRWCTVFRWTTSRDAASSAEPPASTYASSVNVHFHILRMQDGKILHYYGFMNSKFLYDTLGVELPEIRIPDGWPGEGV